MQEGAARALILAEAGKFVFPSCTTKMAENTAIFTAWAWPTHVRTSLPVQGWVNSPCSSGSGGIDFGAATPLYPEMSQPLFVALDSGRLAQEISSAERVVCYAAPGILREPAEALAAMARWMGPELITVCLDFDERVMRMGFGTLDAVKTLIDAGITVRSTPGLRTGIVVIDDDGYVFTPTALYLEPEKPELGAPNAMRLSRDQAREALARLTPAGKLMAMTFARTDDERQRIKEQAVEIASEPVSDASVGRVERSLEDAPPVEFDLARQVRVFNAYLQYVELSLKGAAIQRRRLKIPASIQALGGSKDLEGRLKTTFDLIAERGELSSRDLESSLNDIRKNFTRSLGKDHGRVVLKAAKPLLEDRLSEFRDDLKRHQETVERDLEEQLDASLLQIVEHFTPLVLSDPPDAMRGGFVHCGPDQAKTWLNLELGRVFPKAESLIQKMELEVRFKDMTFETLNQGEFLSAVKAAFPLVDWDKAYDEFQAAGAKVPGR